ncbi:cytoplasmic dynein 2 intermediate chain 1 isoform X2 [Tachysurus vachellii]|uniref:cytoplasmic dynein 2 intermediate chain 1 isoform X2 n=1 Tax=Tachysurus vachellii TaxID=175792 RepID=UPI00296AC88C|nr:cytoplasmic dynein 2 intermediate chain 1 isoform X2 [Tachysurus vachellii]
MYSGKKITKEDTWRPDDLIRHIRSQEEESGRRERSHRDPERERRKHREESARRGEARDERDKESNRVRGETQYREREKERDGERERERVKRNREKERNKERDREKHRERDLERERERVKERDRGKDTERENRNKEKERDKEKDREREKRDREKVREKEKRDREKDREKPREKERDRAREAVRDLGEERDREKDRERERRRAEREKERRKEKDVSLDVEDKSREREKHRKERHREREHRHGGQEQERGRREHERRETHGHRQHMGQDGEDRREQRRREKEPHEDKVIEQRHRRQDGDGVREREERNKRDQRHTDSNQRDREHESAQRKTLQEVERDVTKGSHQGAKDSGNEDYEDDFEDYEEDFEEFDEDRQEEEGEEKEEEEVREDKSMEVRRELSPRSRREVEAIQRAMEQENELLSTAHSISSTQESEISPRASVDSESHSRKSRAYGKVIDFSAARQREINQQASDKQKKRSVELLRLIDLDFSVTECLLDLPPVREYDLYIKSYGMANTKQAYVQCNEDNMERDTQTDETDITDMWTQHPPESSVACGGPQVSQNASDEPVTRTTVDSKRLAAFLRSATQVMAVLLEENITESKTEKLQSQTHTYSFSEGCVQLNTKLNILQGRQVKLLHFSQTQTHTLLSVHAPCSGSNDVTLDSKTLICVWNIWEPSTPQRILFYEAEVQSCCFSPGKATLVFAGTDIGSVLVWDLREHSGSHLHIRVCEEKWTLRHPTFSTDAVLSGVGHFSPVVSVEPVLVNVGAGLRDPLLPEQEESLGLSFQLGSLDETGLLNLWVVVELPKADYSGSQTDLGLHPGGKVKLLHSSSLQTTPGVDKRILGVTSHLSFILKFLPSDSNHYFIGSNMGLVRHGTRHGLRAVPKLYRPKCRERPAEVTALDFCPAGEPFFLVGCSDGSVRLHTLACDEAVCEWTVGSGHSSVQCVQFSPTRRSVFCALDSASVLHIWDLTQRDESPLITQDLHTDPVSAMAVFGDTTKQNPYSGVALAKHSGRLEIHFLLPLLAIPQAMDAEKLHSLTRETL